MEKKVRWPATRWSSAISARSSMDETSRATTTPLAFVCLLAFDRLCLMLSSMASSTRNRSFVSSFAVSPSDEIPTTELAYTFSSSGINLNVFSIFLKTELEKETHTQRSIMQLRRCKNENVRSVDVCINREELAGLVPFPSWWRDCVRAPCTSCAWW